MFIARGSDRGGRWPDAPRLFSTRHQFLRHCAPYLSRVLSIPRSVSTTINTEFRGIRAHSDPQDATSFRHFPQQFARFMHANSMRFSTNCRLTISTLSSRGLVGYFWGELELEMDEEFCIRSLQGVDGVFDLENCSSCW